MLPKALRHDAHVAIAVRQNIPLPMQNIQKRNAIFSLFSNNHINEVVSMHFDFDDEEVLAHYITLLKSISLKLNQDTVQFFFNKGSFPLYTEAIKLINHRDGMVRAAVRTLTLKVYHIRDPAVQGFVISQPASHYFSRLATYVADQCQVSAAHCFSLQPANCWNTNIDCLLSEQALAIWVMDGGGKGGSGFKISTESFCFCQTACLSSSLIAVLLTSHHWMLFILGCVWWCCIFSYQNALHSLISVV